MTSIPGPTVTSSENCGMVVRFLPVGPEDAALGAPTQMGIFENDQAATKDAFEVLHFIAGKRLAAGRLVVVDATNVPAARRARATLPLPACRDRVRPSRAPLSGAEPRSRGPGLRVLRHSSAETAAPPVAPWPRARGLPPRLRALLPRGGGCRRRRAPAALEQPEARARTVRHHRRRARLPRRARDAAPAARLRGRRGRRARRALRSSPRRAEGRLPGRSRGPWSRHAGRAAPGEEFDGRGKRPLRPREPRHEAHAE